MSLLTLLKLLAILTGHLAVWCTVFNQVHATRWSRRVRKTSEKIIFLLVAVLGLALVVAAWRDAGITGSLPLRIYSWLCLTAFVGVVLRWVWRKIARSQLAEVVSERRQMTDPGQQIADAGYHGWQARLLGRVPGNQSLKLSVEHRVFRLQGWPAELDGLVLAHLSDFHFTGKISREWFEAVTRQCNECNPDVVVVTGDIVDTAACLDWLPSTLGKLRDRFGKFYILGNHDLRVRDEWRLREAIEATGFRAVAGQWHAVTVRGATFYITGNELPWFSAAEKLTTPAPGPSIVLSHSPDQIYRAEQMGAVLMLAGHCHGGQIRLPMIGPLVSPSRYGVRFAGGTYKVGGTLLHVSRGLSGDDPIRWNCPPELNIIKLESP